MRQRMLPLLIGAIVILGIVVGAIYFQTQKDTALLMDESSESEPAADSGSTAGDSESASPVPATNTQPDLTVDANGLSQATVVLKTSQGEIKYKFYPEDAPKTVARMIELINSGFYDGLSFHRVEPGFVIQGGDPEGTGRGGSGQKLDAEFNSRRHLEGTVAMARAADPNSADSQFYITLGPQPHLDRNYTVYGQVVEGMDVVRKIQKGDKIMYAYIQ